MAEGNKEGTSSTTQNSQNAQNTQIKFLDSMIKQWMRKTGSIIALVKQEEQPVQSNPSTQDIIQNKNRIIEDLRKKLKKSEQTKISLASTLEGEARYREELNEKMSTTWETIDTITNYYNYVSESLAAFQKHRADLSGLYDNVIVKQQEAVVKLKSDCDKYIAQLRDKALQEERLREATAERDKLREQLENSKHELALKQNELANIHAENLMRIQELQQLTVEHRNLQSHLESVEKEKCYIKDCAAQLENKLQLQEERMQQLVAQQTQLQSQSTNAENELIARMDRLVHEHNAEKTVLLEEQHQLLSQIENLQSLLNKLEQEKNNITAMIAQKDALLSNLENEISTYKNQLTDAEQNVNTEKNKLLVVHAEEKKMLLQDQRQLLSEIENLKSQFSLLERDKHDIAEIIAQKDELLASLWNEISTYKDQLKNAEQNLHTERNKLLTVHAEEKNMLLEKQQRMESELENLRSQLNQLGLDKQDCAKTIAQKDLLLANLENEVSLYMNQIKTVEQNSHKERNTHAQEKQLLLETQRQLVSEVENLQLQLNTLQDEKIDTAETMAQKDTLISNLENKTSTYENKIESMLRKQSILEDELATKAQMLQNLLTTSSGTKQRETRLINDLNRIEKKLSSEMEFSRNLKDELLKTQRDLQLAHKQNDEIKETLEKVTAEMETLQNEKENIPEQSEATCQITSCRNEYVLPRSTPDRAKRQKSAKRKYQVQFDSEISEINEDEQKNVSTSGKFNNDDDDDNDNNDDSPRIFSPSLTSLERESQKEQVAEVTSVPRKFFRSRPPLRRTYSRRQL